MYFDFYSVNDWIKTNPISVKTVYKLYTTPDYDINHRIIESNKYILLYTLDGLGSIRVDGQEFQLDSNSLIFANASNSLSYKCSGDRWNFWLFEFKTEPFLLRANDVYHTPFKMEFFVLCDQILLNLKNDKQQLASAYFYLFYCILVDKLNNNKPSFDITVINKSLEYMKDNMKNFSLQSLSTFLNIPKRTIFYIFNKEVGTSPNRYFQGVRMELGKEYLESTHMDISEISSALGYCSSSHFSTVFKQFVGVTPARYRREFELRNLG
ncbi:helix-turn-helix domain-containing protein [Paenibacillus pini]|uniref:Two component transcriptional regulator n=1 Tax=Paenibacillus pini JCM 16418 TaxID=1236976 RepID=W7Y9I7_9BACL|nr:AraC family transcriptional regulator [Paenibacillus pini]GAF07665.1 two component transcriptional regulator [Paenibacillus pini JCM 16418]